MASRQEALHESLSGQAAVLSELSLAYIEPRLKALGINIGTFELLSAVQASQGRTNQAELARRLGIAPPSLCEALKIAVAKGLVEQVATPDDLRSKTVRLTKQGAKALEATLEALAEMEALLRRSLDPGRVREAVAVVADANRILGQAIQRR